ncbi:MAG TPA: glutamate--tRNA ligase family protein [Kiritimatiellia bacterium]|nr:glutamate--tRNA ligase family protein [Kiritimatiellia bacterium]HMO99061.1 glutamate--tRNA ligase family protein [Kiritimatiellia bacterium]HMP97590.1 glutamate--tRNA ligase family protein [Kiritimatiellia bacterium]
MKVRCRFAPSPTGHVHIGNMRAAIYNWLYARHHGGAFLLRVEDTDRERSTPEAVQTVLDAMTWLGLDVDEPALYQSTRREAHLAAAERLLQSGHAYKLDKGGTGKGEAVLFRMPGRDMSFHDEIKGELHKGAADLPDFVIVRSDGNPVFHLANVVDDLAMDITHVIRGDDHVENTYRHVALFEALDARPPTYAHLPMIVNAQGKPYSKRDGAAFVGEFQEQGYLAEALFNYLVLLGWSPGDDREVMPRTEIVERFSLDRVQAKPAQFDMKKFLWMNNEYIQRAPEAEWTARFRAAFPEATDDAYLEHVIALMKPRVKVWADIAGAAYFFRETFPIDHDALRKRLEPAGTRERVAALRDRFAALASFDAAALEAELRALAEAAGLKPADLIHPVRLAVSGQAGGPSLFHLLEVLGRDVVLRRLDRLGGF